MPYNIPPLKPKSITIKAPIGPCVDPNPQNPNLAPPPP